VALLQVSYTAHLVLEMCMNRVEYLERLREVALEEEIEKARQHAEWVTEGEGGGEGEGEGARPPQSPKTTGGGARALTLTLGAGATGVKGPRWTPHAGRGVDVDGIDRAYDDLIAR